MPKSGKEMLSLFLKAGWEIVRKRGSHVQISKGDQNETIPMHHELKKGLESALLKRLKES